MNFFSPKGRKELSMPNRAPEDATTEELEIFLRSHEVPIQVARDDPRYRTVLIDRSKILLRIMGRETIHVERRSFLNRLINRGKKQTHGRFSPSETECALSVATEPVVARRRKAYERRQRVIDPELSEENSFLEPEYAEPPAVISNPLSNQLRNLTISATHHRFSDDVPPPLPPKPKFILTSSDPGPSSNVSSMVEVQRAPARKRVKESVSDHHAQDFQDISMRNRESTKIAPAPPVVVQSKQYTTKFTTIFNDATDDIEQYLIALKRWQRLNNIGDKVAISVALQNFKNCELSNYTETALSDDAFRNLEIFCAEVKQMLGKTQNQWLDVFDSVKRKNNESCFTFFARLQTVLRNALGVTKLNAEHERLIVRKFLKSLNPTLRGHLESRDEPVNFHNAAMIANRIELALGLPKGSTVTEVHNIVPSTCPPQKQRNRNKMYCHICCREGLHSTAYCYGNPNSDNFNLEKFKVVTGVSKN